MERAEKKVIETSDVARRAGVSQATASRAFGGRGYASAKVREKVLQAVRKLGYRPHAVAQPAFQLGHLSTEQLIARLEEEGSAAPSTCVTLDPKLIVRESCRSHPG